MSQGQRCCHRLREVKTTSQPSNLCVVDTETWPKGTGKGRGQIEHRFRLGVAWAGRLVGKTLTREKWVDLTRPTDFFDFLGSRLDKARPLWVFAHNLHFDFRILEGFIWLESLPWRDWKIVTTDPPFILKGKLPGGSVVFVDTFNYFRQSLEEIGRDLEEPKGLMPPFTATNQAWYDYCRQDVRVTRKAVLSLLAFVREHDCGPLGTTLSACSFAAFRKAHMEKSIFLHDRDDVHQLERESYFGGRAIPHFIGVRNAEHYLLDVNGLYPDVMRTNLFPCRLIHSFKDLKPARLLDWMQDRGAIARCIVDTDNDCYLTRLEKEPWQFRGKFRTTLAGPELLQALERNQVKQVEFVALYELADLFSGFVSYFTQIREKYRREGNRTMESLSKLFLNGLFGKWGQHAPRFVEDPHQRAPSPWCMWVYKDLVSNTRREMRSYAGVVQERVGEGEPWHSFPAIASYVTSYGRVRMDQLAKIAGHRHYFYEDTDSLIVDVEGLENLLLAGELHQRKPGKLKILRAGCPLVVNTPKDYELGEFLVLKGFRTDKDRCYEGLWDQWQWTSAEGSWKRKSEPTILSDLKAKKPSRLYTRRERDAEGFTHPWDFQFYVAAARAEMEVDKLRLKFGTVPVKPEELVPF